MRSGLNRKRRRIGARSAAGKAVYAYLLATSQGVGTSIAMEQAVAAWRELRPEDDDTDARHEIRAAIARKLTEGPDGCLVWRQ